MNCCFLDLLGIPFKLHGRNIKTGLDCYGLVLEIESRLGREMVDLNRPYLENNEKDLDQNIYNIIKASKLEKTDEQEFGNVLMFYDNKGRVCHIGVLLKNQDFIHCDCLGVHISNLQSYNRKWEIYKWQK